MALAEPVGELLLQLFVHRQRPVRGPRSGRAGAELRDGVACSGDDVGMQGQPQVIVRAEHQRWAPADRDLARSEHALHDRRAGNGRRVGEGLAPSLDCAQLVEQIHPSPAWP